MSTDCTSTNRFNERDLTILIEKSFRDAFGKTQEMMLQELQPFKEQNEKMIEELRELKQRQEFYSLSSEERIAHLERVDKEIEIILEQKNSDMESLKREQTSLEIQKCNEVQKEYEKNFLNVTAETKKDYLKIIDQLQKDLSEYRTLVANIDNAIKESNSQVEEKKQFVITSVRNEFSKKFQSLEDKYSVEIRNKKSKYPQEYWDEYENSKGKNSKRPRTSDKEKISNKKIKPADSSSKMSDEITESGSEDEEKEKSKKQESGQEKLVFEEFKDKMIKSVNDWIWNCAQTRGYLLHPSLCLTKETPVIPWRSKVGRNEGDGQWVEELPITLLAHQWYKDTEFFKSFPIAGTVFFTNCLRSDECPYVSSEEKKAFRDRTNHRFKRQLRLGGGRPVISTYIIIKRPHEKKH